jgi:hypothetical protein
MRFLPNKSARQPGVCLACREEIKPGAMKCIHCETMQDWRRHLAFTSTNIALLTALVAVVPASVHAIAWLLATHSSQLTVDLSMIENVPVITYEGAGSAPFSGSVMSAPTVTLPASKGAPSKPCQIGSTPAVALGKGGNGCVSYVVTPPSLQAVAEVINTGDRPGIIYSLETDIVWNIGPKSFEIDLTFNPASGPAFIAAGQSEDITAIQTMPPTTYGKPSKADVLNLCSVYENINTVSVQDDSEIHGKIHPNCTLLTAVMNFPHQDRQLTSVFPCLNALQALAILYNFTLKDFEQLGLYTPD